VDKLASNSLNISAALKAAGDPMRLDILKIMHRDSFGVLELCQIFEIQQPSMSHHLKVMAKAGILISRREGNSIFYSRVLDVSQQSQSTLRHIYAISEDVVLDESVLERVSIVQESRKQKAQKFFQENVDNFLEQQDLIASFKDYGDVVQSLLKAGSTLTWLEVGAGQGELLAAFSDRYAECTALDISKDLLAQCAKNVGQLPAINYFLGDTVEAYEKGITADVISCNMVLHHAPSPASVIADMAKILNKEGQLVICDLDQHDQEWAHTSCGDLWLGFAPDELSQWALNAGLTEGRSQFLALRNGFRVQIREFIKETK